MLKTVNFDGPSPAKEDLTTGFSFQVPPSSDIWDLPPSSHRFNAPILYRSMPLANFKSARATMSAHFSVAYEQIGLVMVVNPAGGGGPDGGQDESRRKWVKSGIEYTDNNTTHISVVGKDRWPDWSIADKVADGENVTIEIRREEEQQLGLAVYHPVNNNNNNNNNDEGGRVHRVLLRALPWLLDLDGTEECWVGVYGAKPQQEEEKEEAKGGQTLLTAHFRDLVIDSF